MSKFIRRITLIAVESGSTQAIYKKRRKKRRVSGWLEPVERRHRGLAKALKSFSDSWLTSHRRSNRKRRNGWLRDGGRNLMRARRKAFKQLRRI